jgi:hypothetical protein
MNPERGEALAYAWAKEPRPGHESPEGGQGPLEGKKLAWVTVVVVLAVLAILVLTIPGGGGGFYLAYLGGAIVITSTAVLTGAHGSWVSGWEWLTARSYGGEGLLGRLPFDEDDEGRPPVVRRPAPGPGTGARLTPGPIGAVEAARRVTGQEEAALRGEDPAEVDAGSEARPSKRRVAAKGEGHPVRKMTSKRRRSRRRRSVA